MFKKNTYITSGINSSLSPIIILTLWTKLQETKGRKLDYLQIFELENIDSEEGKDLKVVWKQEVPEHKEVFIIKGETTEVEKVWVICSGEGTDDEYSTMLLPEEY